jgi:hypothetical protein
VSNAQPIKPGSHARLSASSAERWATCPGSVALSEGVPRGSSSFAAEGTVAHHIASLCLLNGDEPKQFLGMTFEADGFEFTADEDMIAAVEEYVHYVLSTEREGDEGVIEQSFTPALKRLHPEFGGNTDYARYRDSERLLEIMDYKHGAGVPVDVDDNMQLKYYALGALLSNPHWKPETVRITIVQPRCDHEQGRIRSYDFPAIDLVDFAGELVAAAKRTEEFGADLVPSKKACRWCAANAANKCPAIERETQALVAQSFDMLEPEKYSLAQIAEFLDKAPLVEARISAMREFAYQRASAGETIPGHKLVEKRATRHWKDPVMVAEYLEPFAPEAFTEPKLKSPAQVEKLLGKKEFQKRLGDAVDKTSSGFTLVSDKDSRPAVSGQTAQLEDFGVIDE